MAGLNTTATRATYNPKILRDLLAEQKRLAGTYWRVFWRSCETPLCSRQDSCQCELCRG
jgi:hypothetical protein